jgi:hypothetical protein
VEFACCSPTLNVGSFPPGANPLCHASNIENTARGSGARTHHRPGTRYVSHPRQCRNVSPACLAVQLYACNIVN